jgi:formate-dependent nitrite reductase cytochrome c552 subunit
MEARRLMDCMDCHNRPTHVFELPGPALDLALGARLVDPSLPHIKQKGMEVLQEPYSSQGEAVQQIRERLRAFYQSQYPEREQPASPSTVDQAAEALIDIYRRNVFPQMNIFWGTYPNNLGHDPFPGCFRCHDGSHSTPDGARTIPNDCDTCHSLLAVEESDPEILSSLGLP